MDLSVTDFFEHLLNEEGISSYGLYIEGLNPGDGIRLMKLVEGAQEKGKFVVVYKAGRTEAGMTAAKGHTAAMAGELTPQRFYGLWQARRRHKPFLKRLLAKLEGMHRKGLVERLRNHTVKHQIAPRLQRRMDLLTGALDKAGTSKSHTR